MNFGQSALHVLKSVAPMLATAALGPFGPLAGATISAALGTDGGDSKTAEAALLNATPDQLLALKKAEQDFQVQMKQLDISEEKLSFDDTASARAREQVVKDKTPMVLALGITAGFFGTLGFMLINGKPATGGDALLVMLGSLGTAWAGVVSYYFGSSAGSASKTDAINKVIASR